MVRKTLRVNLKARSRKFRPRLSKTLIAHCDLVGEGMKVGGGGDEGRPALCGNERFLRAFTDVSCACENSSMSKFIWLLEAVVKNEAAAFLSF